MSGAAVGGVVSPPVPALPDTLGALLRVGLDDLRACEADAGYRIDMACWHTPDPVPDDGPVGGRTAGPCAVCLAGAVMARSLGADPARSASPAGLVDRAPGAAWMEVETTAWDASGRTYDKLSALDDLRCGRASAAGGRMLDGGIDEALAGLDRDVPAYAEGPEGLVQGAVAYEPVWAIGTGVAATPEQADAMHGVIRQTLAAQDAALADEQLRVLYGGSVTANNAAELFNQTNVDGGLVGGASLEAESFLAVAAAVG